MGDVQLGLKVMPAEGADLGALEVGIEEALKGVGDLLATETEPIAFGLEALVVTVVVPDEAGGSDAVEETLSELEGVQSVEVADMTRLM